MRVDELTKWVFENEKVILARKQIASRTTLPRQQLEVNFISTLIALKAEDVRLYKIKARVTNLAPQGIRTTITCSHCGRSCAGSVGDKFVCTACKKPSTCIAKMYLDFVAVDSTGTLALCPPTRAVEMILMARAYLISAMDSEICCSDGEIRLAPIMLSDIIHNLYTRMDDYGAHFRQYARLYNNFFAFSSLGGELESYTKDDIHTLQLQGQLYHFLPNLVSENNRPNFLQMYFYDGALELNTRITGFRYLLPEIIQLLMSLTQLNPYARFFRAIHTLDMSHDFRIVLSRNPVLDQRAYNAPTTDKVAVIFVDNQFTDVVHSPEIIVHAHGNHTHRVMHYYGCYDPLQYPILFCRGECGSHQGLERSRSGSYTISENSMFPMTNFHSQTASDLFHAEVEASSHGRGKKRSRISCRSYYSYRFQMRSVISIINMGRIFMQYIVDMYVKIENTRLDYIRQNQQSLRCELYQGIVDSVNDGIRDPNSIGRRVILRASFIGGPRDMKCCYLNAMALVQKFGKPDIFLTMTCNPAWPEIESLLQPWETPQDRPDVIARIFRAKVVHLKDLIIKQHIFGFVAAHVDVVEFQKRGLPHLHMLIILDPTDKIKTYDRYDEYLRAELPPLDDALLRSRVVQHMMHGPCGEMNVNCGCMKEKNGHRVCRFHYPKEFALMTTAGKDTYPIYQRRDNGDNTRVRGKKTR